MNNIQDNNNRNINNLMNTESSMNQTAANNSNNSTQNISVRNECKNTFSSLSIYINPCTHIITIKKKQHIITIYTVSLFQRYDGKQRYR